MSCCVAWLEYSGLCNKGYTYERGGARVRRGREDVTKLHSWHKCLYNPAVAVLGCVGHL